MTKAKLTSGIEALLIKYPYIFVITSIFLSFMGNATYADLPAGTRMDAEGIIVSLDDNGIFAVEGSSYKYRLFQLKLSDNFPKNELIGQRVACHSFYSLEETRALGYSEEVIPAHCQFTGLFSKGNLHDALLNVDAAKEACDPEFNYILGCRFEKQN